MCDVSTFGQKDWKAIVVMKPTLLQKMWANTASNASSNTTMTTYINHRIKGITKEPVGESKGMDVEDTNYVTTVFHIPCIAHTLQLAVKEEGMLKSQSCYWPLSQTCLKM